MNAYADHNKTARIKRVYFYMLESNGVLVEYFIRSSKHIAWDEMPAFIDEIAAEIDEGSIPASQSIPGSRDWRKRSYIVYYDRDAHLSPNEAVEFSAVPIDDTCFRDGKDVFRGRQVYAFYCINHMRKAGSDQGPHDKQQFKVVVNHDHRSMSDAGGDEKEGAAGHPAPDKRLGHEDSGTNTGPP